VPRANPAKNAVLQHAAKYEGDGPYTPAPPKSGQAGILQVFRRLSSSTNGMGPALKGNHGLVERKILNVDHHRERCPLEQLNQAKLRKVSFCVDVEIAPMPKYADPEAASKKVGDAAPKRKMSEKGEGEALKRPKSAEEVSESAAKESLDTIEEAPTETKEDKAEKKVEDESTKEKAEEKEPTDASSDKNGDGNKKKEKKKKSEEERKARKEKKRKLAEANGSIPMEIHVDSDSSGTTTPTEVSSPRVQLVPTTNPVRIYRRCCQLRETPILKRITEQLSNTANFSSKLGQVDKLDLTGYWLQLPDLVTLGDYLAVVPIREVVLENCGLTDEGLRVVLAGLLAAKRPEKKQRHLVNEASGLIQQGGVVESLVLKNNKIGPEGWKHICLFVYLCRSLRTLDISNITFPQSAAPLIPQIKKQGSNASLAGYYHEEPQQQPMTLYALLARALSERLGGDTLELLNMGDTGLSTKALGDLVDGVINCGIKRLGLANNEIDPDGVQHIARYLRSGVCEGLDLGGNDLRDQLDVLADAMDEKNPLWALSLVDCNLKPASCCKLLCKITKLPEFRFIDLSHNQDLFKMKPSALSLLRKTLPKMPALRRIHLADVSMTSEHAIALAEILPEIQGLAHINLLENPELAKLAHAKTEEAQEEAAALFAALLAATRVSKSIVAVDIDVPAEESGEVVRAMAKQVVAYCLRNMERLPISGDAGTALKPDPEYPDVIQHLVGHDVLAADEPDELDAAPDDDYVIGGTGVVKALAYCLDHMEGDESRTNSAELTRELQANGFDTPPIRGAAAAKAKDMSLHLLLSARKIRIRLQPPLAKARAAATLDSHAYRKGKRISMSRNHMLICDQAVSNFWMILSTVSSRDSRLSSPTQGW